MKVTGTGPDNPGWIRWNEEGEPVAMPWYSGSGLRPPRRVRVVDDQLNADTAFRLASEGEGMIWRGDYHNARQLLQAVARRIERRPPRLSPQETLFNRYRLMQSRRVRTLNHLLVVLERGYRLDLSRAPDVAEACEQALGPSGPGLVLPLRELLGMIGAYEWRRKGVPVAALKARVHPYYGVFAPVRDEYVNLVAHTPLPAGLPEGTAIDVGTGSGVLAAVLARRGVRRVVATDISAVAVACARENIERLGLSDCVTVAQADLFPSKIEQVELLVCNPPWLPARPVSDLDHAIYDPDSRMLKAFLAGAAQRLAMQGEAWLILSDLAEHLGLRTRDELLRWIQEAGLRVVGRHDVQPTHRRVSDRTDLLHAARAAEVTSLWRLMAR